MKMLHLVLALSLHTGARLHAEPADPVAVDAPVDRIFVPSGFDDNDNVEVVLHGEFPNACYHTGLAKASVDESQRLITIDAQSLVYPDEFCIQSLTPFIQPVSLGHLTEGPYEIVYKHDPAIKASLDVARRKTESPDDYLYATVENAFIDVNPDTGKQALKLQGHFPYYLIGCMVIKEVRVVRDPTDVLVVRPIAEVVNTDVCSQQPLDHSFTYTAGLDEPFHGEGLLHVRTMNGTSLNRLIHTP